MFGKLTIANRMVTLMFASTNTYLAYFILDCWMEVNAVGNEVSTILSYRVVIVLFIDV